MNSPTPDERHEMRGSNQVGMRHFNERTVLRAIRHHGALPKADLARLTQLTPQTVATIAKRLLDEGLLAEQDRIRGKIGQPSVPLALNPDGAFHLGIQVDRRSLNMVVVDFMGQMRHQWQQLYPYPDPRELPKQVVQGMQRMRKLMGPAWPRLMGVGLSAPLSLHQWGDVMGEPAASAMAAWEHLDLRQEVARLSALPVEFAKDTTAACLAELVRGHGRQVQNFLYVFIGTFVGGGLVLDGQVFSGPRGNAGAIGSMPVLTTPRGAEQLLERASGWQLEQALMRAGHAAELVHHDSILDAAYAPCVQPWLAQASQALAMSMVSAAALLDLDAVVLDGSLHAGLLQQLMAMTRLSLAQQRFDGIRPPELQAGSIGGHACALGAALLPLHAQFLPDRTLFLKQAR
jgi:predicted NBD/HSP70 family sugar kinase